MFPIIEHLNDLLPQIAENKQIRIKTEENGLTVVCYMVQDEDTFAGTDLQFAVECRGVTFDQNGRIAARTLHKFFNVGEHDSVRPEVLPWADVDRIMEKRDGSMVTPVRTSDGGLKFKTKKTFSSKEAALADQIMAVTNGGLIWVDGILGAELTPTFEVTSPKFPIVLKYERDELTLLHIRENITGRYLTEDEIFATNPPFPVVTNLKNEFMDFFGGIGGADTERSVISEVSWQKLHEAQQTREGLEGWVVQFKSGDMVKVKTKWYCDLHHAVTFTRWRDIARSVCADQSDDLKAAFAMTGRSIEPILKVERSIGSKINITRNAVEAHAENGRALNRTAKEMALAFKDREDFGLVMRMFRGSEVNWMEWYAKNHLENDFGLEVVGDNE